jgi:hypothetical protein
MSYAEVDRKYLELKSQFDAGLLGRSEFDDSLRALMVQDEQGRWWAKARESGQWHVYDAIKQNWVAASPPSYMQMPASPATSDQDESSSFEPSYTPAISERIDAAPYQDPTFGAASQPELSPGMKVIFYILSFLVPIIGIIFFFVYRGKPTMEDRVAANRFLKIGLVSFGLTCLCSVMIPLMLSGL